MLAAEHKAALAKDRHEGEQAYSRAGAEARKRQARHAASTYPSSDAVSATAWP